MTDSRSSSRRLFVLDLGVIETLIQTGEGEGDRRNPSNWCVGITVDPIRGQMYWTQKGAGDWTDRGDPPRGNSVSRTPIDGHLNQQILLDGSEKRSIAMAQGNLSGIAYAEEL